MNDGTGNRIGSDKQGNDETLSGPAILVILAILALVCVGGYFFLMKLIAVSQQDDCILAHRRNCAPAEPLR